MKGWKFFTIALLMVTMTFFSGCWDYQEVENMYIVGGIAIDKGIQGHKYHMTFEVLDLSGGAQSSSMKGKLLESEGDTIADAVASVTKSSDKTMYFSDCKIVVFSKDIAAVGMTPVLDWLNRDPLPRFTVQLYLSQEKTAGEILKGTGNGQEVVSFNISNMSKESYSDLGEYVPVQLNEADNILWGQGKDLTIPCLDFGTGQFGKQIELNNTAVFRGDKLVGLLNEEQSQFFLFAADNIQGGLLLTGANPDDTDISLQIQKSSTSVNPVIQGNKIEIELKIKMKASFDEENTSKNFLSRYGVATIEQFADKTLESKVKKTISDVQDDFGSDIFGFGQKVYDKDPKLWGKVKPNWYQYFRTLKCSVTAQVQITDSGFAFPKGHG